MVGRLLITGALLWASAFSSPAAVQKVEFHPMVETFVPDPADPNIIRFPHQESCHHFYYKLSEEDISIKKCPEEELFDYLKHKCVEKESAKCWNRLIMDKKNHGDGTEAIHSVNKGKDFPWDWGDFFGKSNCPHPYGKFPDVTDCTRYHQCLFGKSSRKKCAPYEYFDKIKRKCMAEIDAICADNTDVVEADYKCPRVWGSFSFSKDCSKYYECYEKKPDLRTCKKHMVFDDKKMKCMPHKDVHCGSRYSPYDHLTTQVSTTTEAIQEITSPTVKDEITSQTATDIPKSSYRPLVTNGHSSDQTDEAVVTKEFITVEKETSEESSPPTTVESKRISTENILTTKENLECHSNDESCILEKDGSILRCPSPNGLFSHPKDETMFLHCSNKFIYVKKCPNGLVFLESKQACTWSLRKFPED